MPKDKTPIEATPQVLNELDPGEQHPAEPIVVSVAPITALPPADPVEAPKPPQPAEPPSRAFVGYAPNV